MYILSDVDLSCIYWYSNPGIIYKEKHWNWFDKVSIFITFFCDLRVAKDENIERDILSYVKKSSIKSKLNTLFQGSIANDEGILRNKTTWKRQSQGMRSQIFLN